MIIGIDPGKKGALAAIDIGGKVKRLEPFDGREGFEFFEWLKIVLYELGIASTATKENFPSFGLTNSTFFVMGYQHALIDLAFRTIGIRLNAVEPREWVKTLHGDKNSDLKPKIRNLKLAEELFPGVDMRGPKGRKPHEGIVDALLVAEYHRREVLEEYRNAARKTG